MKFLVDQCLSPRLASLLRDAGHDVVHVRDREMQRASDTAILDLAESERRVLLSADSDFGDILTLGDRRGPSLVLFRGEFSPTADEQARQLLACLTELVAVLEKGAIVVLTSARTRVREL